MCRILAVSLLLFLAPAAQGQSWSTGAPLPVARQEVAVTSLDGRVYVLGGLELGIVISDRVDVYDPATNLWSQASPLPVALHHATAAAVDGTLFVIGGWLDLFANATNAVWAYDPLADDWSPRQAMPTARGSMGVAALDGRIYVAGGEPAAREQDFAVYEPATDSWTSLPSMPTPRNHLAAGAIDGRFLAVGGRSGGIGGITGALEAYDPVSGQWTALAPMPTARGGIAGAVIGGYLIVFGGEGNPAVPSGVFEEVEAYEAGANDWVSLPPMPNPRHGIGAGVVGEVAWIPAGAPVQGLGISDLNEAFDAALAIDFCSDAVDNDADGASDSGDTGCTGAGDSSEWSPEDPCDNGVDDDGDGGTDFRIDAHADLGCRDTTWPREDPQCQDGVDNDHSIGTDFDAGESVLGIGNGDPDGADPQCSEPWQNRELANPGAGCGLGPELAPLLALLWGLRRKRSPRKPGFAES